MSRALSDIEKLIAAEAARMTAAQLGLFAAELKGLRDAADQLSLQAESIAERMEALGQAIPEAAERPDGDGAKFLKVLSPGADEACRVVIETRKPTPEEVGELMQASSAPAGSPIAMLQPAEAPREAPLPGDSPDWLAPALAKLRPEKEKQIARRIAREGGVSLQEVIYHFSPPIKESYATVILSNVRSALKGAGLALDRDAEFVYRVRADT